MHENYRSSKWIGKKFGMLTVNRAVHHVCNNGSKCWYWEVTCDCGNVKEMNPRWLIHGSTVSCGCYRKTKPSATKTHGDSHKPLHDIWCGIRKRCKNHPRYSGRGISVCDEWSAYENFKAWALENGYEDGLTIDRIDVNGNYCPENCRWVPLAEQARNRTTTFWVDYEGRRMSLAEAAELAGLPYKQVHLRIKKGWSVYDALHAPLGTRRSNLQKVL